MSDKLSDRWKSSPLRSLTSKIGSGATPRGGKRAYKKSGTPLIRSMNVHCDGFRANGLAYLDDKQAAALNGVIVQAGDVLLNITGASIGRVTQAPREMDGARVSQHVCIIRPVKGLEPSFVARYLASPSMQAFIAGENYGVTRQALTKEMIENISFPVPPLNEQRLIVAKMDNLFVRSKRARKELSGIPRLVERYKQTFLTAAFRGDVTRDDSTKWPTLALGYLIDGIDAGKNIRCDERPPARSERGIVKVSSVTWGSFDPLAAKTPRPGAALNPRSLIRSGDFLISRANTLELVGACIIVGPVTDNNLYLSDKVLRIRFKQPVEPWVLHYLRSKEGREQIESLSTGNQLSMRNISQAAIKAIRIPLPPEDVRSRILTCVEKALTSISSTLRETKRATAFIDRLDLAVLAKAFRGELVEPQQTVDTKIAISQ
jgi:type I restriction enzyme, S subunit